MLRYVFGFLLSVHLSSMAFARVNVNDVTLDNPKSCAATKLILEPKLTAVPAIFRATRTVSDTALAKSCVEFTLRKAGYTYAKCPSANGQPTYYGMGEQYKACVTPNYFNSVYNTYTDVMDCLGIDPRLLLPKLYVESGLHINSFNKIGFDSGVGQLTTPAIEDVLGDSFDIRTSRVKTSQRPSCQRLASIPGIFNKIPTDKAHRCVLIEPGANPARNIMFTGFYTQVLDKRVTALINNQDVVQKMRAAGLTSFDSDRLVEMLAMLAYNVGPSTAVSYLESYLEGRIAKIKAKKGLVVKTSDFDAQFDVDQDFLTFKDVNTKYAKNKAYGDNLLVKVGIQNVTFPRFLVYEQDIGGRGYITHLARMKKKLDTETEANLCTTEEFLKLR